MAGPRGLSTDSFGVQVFLRFVLRRAGAAAVVVVLATFVAFLLLQLVPGDPAVAIAGDYATDEQLDAIRTDLGLDRPLLVQYLNWIGGVLTGDWGMSYSRRAPITEVMLDRLPVTVVLVASSIVVAVVVGTLLGLYAAVRVGRWSDRVVTFISGIGIAAPNFWIGMVLISVFAVSLRWLPAIGVHDVFEDPAETVRAMILPVLALALAPIAEMARQVRSAMIETLASDYTRTNVAKGLSAISVYGKHGLKNAGVPLITVIGLMVGRLLGGTVVIETVFGIPGIGGLIVESVQSRDYPVTQAVVLMLGLTVVAVNFLTDVLVAVADPRISHGRA